MEALGVCAAQLSDIDGCAGTGASSVGLNDLPMVIFCFLFDCDGPDSLASFLQHTNLTITVVL